MHHWSREELTQWQIWQYYLPHTYCLRRNATHTLTTSTEVQKAGKDPNVTNNSQSMEHFGKRRWRLNRPKWKALLFMTNPFKIGSINMVQFHTCKGVERLLVTKFIEISILVTHNLLSLPCPLTRLLVTKLIEISILVTAWLLQLSAHKTKLIEISHLWK